MQAGDTVVIKDSGEVGVIRGITNSAEGTMFFNRPIALIKVKVGDGFVSRANFEEELEFLGE